MDIRITKKIIQKLRSLKLYALKEESMEINDTEEVISLIKKILMNKEVIQECLE